MCYSDQKERVNVKKSLKHKRLSVAPQDGPDIAQLINNIQQQLNAVEKKLDILISQSSGKPFESSCSQKPFRSFNQPHRHDKGGQGDGPRGRTFNKAICAECGKECEIPFKPSGDRPVYCKECFSSRRKGNMFNTNRDNRPEKRDFHRGQRFDKSQKPAKKKMPFFGRKKRGI